MSNWALEEGVSVIIPTYFRNDMLAEAIDSVRQQDYEPVEIIVVDDSGEAHARPTVEDIDQVDYVPLDRNRGPHAARDRGLSNASGRYIQFLDDDDVLVREKFKRQIPLFSADIGVVYSGYEIYETGEPIMPQSTKRGDVLDYALQGRLDPACTCTMLIDRRTLDEILPLRNNHGADVIGLMIELAQRTWFDYVDEPLVRIRREQTRTSYSEYPSLVNGLKEILETYAELYDETSRENRCYMKTNFHRKTSTGLLGEHLWSVAAVKHAFLAAYHEPENKTKSAARVLAALFGRPGFKCAQILLESYRQYLW